ARNPNSSNFRTSRSIRVSNRASVEFAAPRRPSRQPFAAIRVATFVTPSRLQLRPTYALNGCGKRSASVRVLNGKEHLSRDSRVIRDSVSWSNNRRTWRSHRERNGGGTTTQRENEHSFCPHLVHALHRKEVDEL